MGTSTETLSFSGSDLIPCWVPRGALHYIAHTEMGHPIRALARQAGCHASTVMRQIRKIEMRRDDPLVDAALRKLGAASGKLSASDAKAPVKAQPPLSSDVSVGMPDEETLAREAMRVLRRLCEAGAVLAVATDMDKAVVVRDLPGAAATRTAVVGSPVAQAMALKDWIAPGNTGRIIRYQITNTGRAALEGFMERFGVSPDIPEDGNDDTSLLGEGTTGARGRYGLGESPLSALARRRDRDGTRFLDDALVRAGERLREDFELAQMDGTITQNWDHFLTPSSPSTATSFGSGVPGEAKARVQAALQHLGPGLSDIALRCCCFLEGLETTEKRLGWSARSGKIVLRIALTSLKRHYDETVGPGGPMIG